MEQRQVFKATNALVVIAVIIQIILWFLGKPVPLLPDLGSPPINIYLPIPADPNAANPPVSMLTPPPSFARVPPHRLREALSMPGTRQPGTANAIRSVRCYACP